MKTFIRANSGEDDKSIFVARGILESQPDELRRQKIGPGEIHLYESQLP